MSMIRDIFDVGFTEIQVTIIPIKGDSYLRSIIAPKEWIEYYIGNYIGLKELLRHAINEE